MLSVKIVFYAIEMKLVVNHLGDALQLFLDLGFMCGYIHNFSVP